MMKYLRLTNADAPFFEEACHLYESEFPHAERRSLSCHMKTITAEPDFFCYALHKAETFVGIIYYWLFTDCVYVEHLAIAAPWRGLGLGKAALEIAQQHGRPVILEIEPVVDTITAARLRFYERAGYHRLSYEHYQLPYHRGESPLRLELLSYPHPADSLLILSFERDFAAKPMLYRDV